MHWKPSACVKAPQVTISTPENIELSADGSSGSITFTANRDWSIRCSDSWVSVSPSSGQASKEAITVKVSCYANMTYEDREAIVTITAEDAIQTTTIKQPANLGVLIPFQSYNLASSARTFDVEVSANVLYTVSITGDWIKQTGTKGLTTNILTFSAEENQTYDAREGTITIKPQESSGVANIVISVHQAQKDAMIVEKKSFDMPYGGGEIEVKVESNVSFNVSPSAEWIHYVRTKAISNSTVVLKIDKNTTYRSRQGTVEIKSQNESLKHTITINQDCIAVTSVDLGLSVKWASCNIGAGAPEEYGDHYAWGETASKSGYNERLYKWFDGSYLHYITKYCSFDPQWGGTGSPDGKTVLDPEDDVAHVKLGGKWRMPTHAEWTELRTECTWTWTSINGINGRLVTGPNGNSIFLPAAGIRVENRHEGAGSYGDYWSSSIYVGAGYDVFPSEFAWEVHFNSGKVDHHDAYRYYGLSVRPVSE